MNSSGNVEARDAFCVEQIIKQANWGLEKIDVKPALACSAEGHLDFQMVGVIWETGRTAEHMDMVYARVQRGKVNTVDCGAMGLSLWESTPGLVETHIVATGTKARRMA